jgi:hypothetical protein
MEPKKSYLRINPSPAPHSTHRMDVVHATECTPPPPVDVCVDMVADASGVIVTLLSAVIKVFSGQVAADR